ncbi:MAG: motility-associated protein, partial [Candidatus Zixiibacteriota bacterium]
MFIFIGAAVVLGSIITGFTLEGGHILALNQPLELLIIGGAA